MQPKKIIGLRIDVDTWRGTKRGVPNLLRILDKHHVKGTFYFSVGPDNMGRHLWRLLKPAFFWKMLRTNAAGLYGPEIILMGTLWPGLQIGKRLANVIKTTYDAGHEIGFHAWDHHREQAKIDRLSADEIEQILRKGSQLLDKICGAPPITSAAPGWRCTDNVLRAKSRLPFRFNSDCRGSAVFYPVIDDVVLPQPQIPVTMPTYDEALGRDGITEDNYNDFMISHLRPGKLNVLTIHAEAEGGKCLEMFDDYLRRVAEKGWLVVALGELLNSDDPIPKGCIIQENFPGREGLLAIQSQEIIGGKDRT